ncbi:MAG: hypothetical protein V7673_11775, partial [Paracoccus sp. (in: a-proteobacteria)]|uniref:hypothetical protein n=1 Tax=Paracoccus sp. TaxID=267 RepID=UPI0030011F6B
KGLPDRGGDDGVLAARDMGQRVAHPSRHRIFRFQEEVVAAFASEFTTVARVANKFAVETSVVISRLRQARMKPVLKRDEIGIDLYRTADLPEFELA